MKSLIQALAVKYYRVVVLIGFVIVLAWAAFMVRQLTMGDISHPMSNFEGRWGQLSPCSPNETYTHYTNGEGSQYDFLTGADGIERFVVKDKIRNFTDKINALKAYTGAMAEQVPGFKWNGDILYPYTPSATFVTYSDTTGATIYTFIRLSDTSYIYLSQDPKL